MVGRIGEIDRSDKLGRLVGVGLVREGEEGRVEGRVGNIETFISFIFFLIFLLFKGLGVGDGVGSMNVGRGSSHSWLTLLSLLLSS